MLFVIGGHVLVEVIGYFWHRTAEHGGWFGETVRYRHWVHHEEDYPVESLRPVGVSGYKSAGSWSWYVLAAVTVILIFVFVPLRDAIPLALGGLLYAWYGLNYFHSAFHIE